MKASLFIALATDITLAAPTDPNIQLVLTQMVSKVFPNCALYFVRGSWEDYPRPTTDLAALFPTQDNAHSSGVFLIDIAKEKEVDITAEATSTRHAPQCAFVILDLQFVPIDSVELNNITITVIEYIQPWETVGPVPFWPTEHGLAP